MAGEQVAESQLMPGLAGELQSEEYRYWVIAPQASGLYVLGFLDKYVTMSGRQVHRVAADLEGVTINMELPAGSGLDHRFGHFRPLRMTVGILKRPGPQVVPLGWPVP
jgi:hypothetical protein